MRDKGQDSKFRTVLDIPGQLAGISGATSGRYYIFNVYCFDTVLASLILASLASVHPVVRSCTQTSLKKFI